MKRNTKQRKKILHVIVSLFLVVLMLLPASYMVMAKESQEPTIVVEEIQQESDIIQDIENAHDIGLDDEIGLDDNILLEDEFVIDADTNGEITDEVSKGNVIEDEIRLEDLILMEVMQESNPVKLNETGELFQTINEAISGGNNAGLQTLTLEITSDVTELHDIIITSNVTMVSTEGSHTINMAPTTRIRVEAGSLTLGDGVGVNVLTISNRIFVTNGEINVKDGIILQGTLDLRGPNVNGMISGGQIHGFELGLDMAEGARLSEISGGVFSGNQNAIHISGTGTRIGEISGGEFHQTGRLHPLHGHAIFVDNNAQIGKISGGYFRATDNSALVLIRGAWIDEISGGEFVATRYGTFAANNRNAAVWIEGEAAARTGVGTISGGHFRGTNFGVLVVRLNQQAQIDRITGGTFEGDIALQNDRFCVIGEISGGNFIGTQNGILNGNVIRTITGNAHIRGISSVAIFNSGGTINEIAGGFIISDSNHGISNSGTIDLISGGTIIGNRNAINSTGMTSGRLHVITGGVFWGKNAVAITLGSQVSLEPNLDATRGFGRYWGRDGVIFNNEDRVTYPDGYHMSTHTLPVDGINEVEFRFLTLINPPLFTVTVNNSFADYNGSGEYPEYEFVSIDAGTREGYTFYHWVVVTGDAILSNMENPTATFTMPANDVVITARWTPDKLGPCNGGGGGDNGGDNNGGNNGNGSGGGDNGGNGGGSNSNGGSNGGDNSGGGDSGYEEPTYPLYPSIPEEGPPTSGFPPIEERPFLVPDEDGCIECDDEELIFIESRPPLGIIPDTGINNHPIIYMILVLASLIGMGIISIRSKRNRKATK